MKSTLSLNLSPRRWLKMAGSSLAVLVLSSVPAFGLIYTGNWIVQQNRQTGGAPKAIVDTSNPGAVTIDFGVNSKQKSSSTVVVRRQFTVQNFPGPGNTRGERVALTDQFASLVRDGFIEIIARIVPTRGSDPIRDNYFRNAGPNSTVAMSRNARFERFLKPGKYTLVITINYVNRKGFWKSASPHRFTLSSV